MFRYGFSYVILKFDFSKIRPEHVPILGRLWLQKATQRSPNASQKAPKGSQNRAKDPQGSTPCLQDVSRGVPRPPKGPYKSTPCLQDVSRGVPRPSRCSYGPRRCGKMAMEYGAEPSYGLWGPWPSTFDWFHRALGLQNRIPLPIAAPGRDVERIIFEPFCTIWLPLGATWPPKAAKIRPKVDRKAPNS